MASVTLTNDRFPAGATVKAFPRSNWPGATIFPSGAPLGSETSSATVAASGAVTLTGLADDTDYWAYAEVLSQHRYVGIGTKTPVLNNPDEITDAIEADRVRLTNLETGTVTFDTPGPPDDDGVFTGQLAVGHDPAGQTTELWRWDGAAWDQEIGVPPFFQVSRLTQSVNSSTTVSVVDFDTADEDPDGLFDLTANFATIERPGVYAVSCRATFATSSATGIRIVAIYDSIGQQIGAFGPGIALANHKGNCSGDLRLGVGDFLYAQVAQSSGSAMNVSTVLTARWVKP